MTQTQSKRRYNVDYYIEAGFSLTVEARSRAQAERLVRKMLDEATDELKGSKRVHCNYGVCGSALTKGGAA